VNLLNAGQELLDAALDYALAGLALATPPRQSHPTPCRGWDLKTLLDHLSDSMRVLADTVATTRLASPSPVPDPGPGGDPAARLRGQAARLRAVCASTGPPGRMVAIDDREITVGMAMVAAAIEVSVHGYDIFAACRTPQPVPPSLAAALLPAAALLVTPRIRPGLFADPVRLTGTASPGDQLIAFLGRQPGAVHATPQRGYS
jgi:uncharacterized protein (TIGR03086 family)